MGRRDLRLHAQAMAILHQCVEAVAQPGLLAAGLAGQLGLLVGGALVGGVAALLAVEVHTRVARIPVGGILRTGLGLETLQAGPGVDERTIDGKVFVTDPPVFLGQTDDASEEQFGGLMAKEPLLVFGESGVVPDGVRQVQIQEPAKQEIIFQGLDEEILGADGIQGLEHLGFEQPFGRDRGPTGLGVHLFEQWREIAQHLVHQMFDPAQRMILGHAALWRNQTIHVGLRFHVSTHANPIDSDRRLFKLFGVFQ